MNNSKDYELLVKAYDRVAGINKDDVSRLYRFAGAYPAVALGLLTWLLKEHDDLTTVSSIFWCVASMASSFYVIFYSYLSAHLVDSAIYLNTIWNKLNNFSDGDNVPSWDGFSPKIEGGSTRWILTYVLTSWRILVWLFSMALWWVGASGEDVFQIASYSALLLALVSGITIVISFRYAHNAKSLQYSDATKKILDFKD